MLAESRALERVVERGPESSGQPLAQDSFLRADAGLMHLLEADEEIL